MRWTDMYVAGVGASFGEPVPVKLAIADGRYNPEAAAKSEQLAVTVARPDQGPLDFAIAAAQQALDRSELEPYQIGMGTVSVLSSVGMEMWNAPSFILSELGITHPGTFVAEVRSGCNGAMAAVELAAGYLTGHASARAALITAGDTFPDDVVDRWSLPGALLGDGGSAIVLSRGTGFARLLATHTRSDSGLEGLHRGRDPFGVNGFPVDFKKRVRTFLEHTMPIEELAHRREIGLRETVKAVTEEAGVPLAEIAHVVYSHIGRSQYTEECLKPLGIPIERTTWEFGRHIGHVGASDPFAGLNYLVTSGRLRPDDRVLLIGAGGGYVWTAAVLEVPEAPRWVAEADPC